MTITLVVEDGSLPAGANTFISLADFKAFSDMIGDTSYSDSDDDTASIALINAAIYLKIRYRWRGDRVKDTQSLVYPRNYVTDDDGISYGSNVIPQAIKDAQCLAAIRALRDGDLLPDVDASQLIKRKRTDVAGAVTTDVIYNAIPRKHYPAITHTLRPYIYSGQNSRLVRA